jgi:ABC-2 type transport system ATP-binding protein
VVALVGPNGSGKTTLMSMAAGLLPASTGRVEAAGGAPAQRLDKIGFVAQDAPLWPRLRVADVLEIGRCMNRGFDAAMASQRIRRLGVRPRARISALSGGERAQVALTLVLAKKPELFLLDEPTSNLDPLARREFLGSMFAACSETGATVLYSSHAVAELERICDYLIVLRSGHLRLAGDIDELRQQHRVISGPDGWPGGGGWQVISQRSTAGRTTALVRRDGAHVAGPGLQDAAPTFDELVLGYLEGDAATLPEEALA